MRDSRRRNQCDANGLVGKTKKGKARLFRPFGATFRANVGVLEMGEMFVMLTGLPKRSVPRGSNLDFSGGSSRPLGGVRTTYR